MAKIKLVVSATIEETFSDFIISRKTKGLAEKTLQSYQSQFQAVARHMDVKMDIAMLQKADLDAMIISMRDASLSPNSINSYTRTLKSFFSWCNEQGITRLNIPLYKAEETVKETYSDLSQFSAFGICVLRIGLYLRMYSPSLFPISASLSAYRLLLA